MEKLGLLSSSDRDSGETQLDILRKFATLSIQEEHFSEALGEPESGKEVSKDPSQAAGDVRQYVWESHPD